VSQGCRPYSFAECEHHISGSRPPCNMSATPECVEQCDDGYKLTYQEDKQFGKFLVILPPTPPLFKRPFSSRFAPPRRKYLIQVLQANALLFLNNQQHYCYSTVLERHYVFELSVNCIRPFAWTEFVTTMSHERLEQSR